MDSVCLDDCGSVHGFCNGTCQCEYPWVNLGDYVPLPTLVCDINFEVSKGLWITVVVVQLPLVLLLITASLLLRRGTKRRERLELVSLLNLVCGNILTVAGAFLEATAAHPGQRSFGIDLTTTVLLSVGESLVIFHAVLLPFVQSGTSVLPFALAVVPVFQKRKYLMTLYYAILILLTVGSQFLVIVVVYYPHLTVAIFSTIMAFFFVLSFSSGLLTYYLTTSLLATVSMLSQGNSRDLSSAQKVGFRQTEQRARNTRIISLIVIILYSPQFLIFAAWPIALMRAGWAWLPLRRLFVTIFDYRHPYLSMMTSLSHRTNLSGKSANNNDEEAEERDQATELKNTFLSLNKHSSKVKKKILTRVEEERTVDIRTEQDTQSPAVEPMTPVRPKPN